MADDKKRIENYMVGLSQLKEERQEWEQLWADIVHYCSPKRDMWDDNQDQTQGEVKKGKQLYDTHAVEAAKTEANGLVGWNAGPMIKWLKLKMLIEEMNELPYAKDWLELCERRMYMMFHRSNFYDQLFEYFLDLVTVGTATMLIEENPNNMMINYSTRHPKETYIIEGLDGRVDSVYREIWFTGQQLLSRYGEEALPEKFLKDIHDPDDKKRMKNLVKKHRIIHIIEPRADRNPASALATNKPFASVELLPDLDADGIIRESGYDEFPVVVTRWSKNSNEKYGRSPAMDGLPTIKRGNQEKYSTLRAAQMAVEPPLQMPPEMQRRLDLSPLGRNVYKNPSKRIFPLDIGSGYPFGRDVMELIHDEIDNMFMVPLFRMLDRLDRQVTAREVMERQGERVSSLSGPLTRQNSEGLGPMVMRSFNIMARNGMMPPPPPDLVKAGVPLDVEFTGLLSQAQRRYQQAQSLNAGLATINGLVQMAQNPALLDNIDMDDLIRKIAESEGFPASAVREMPEIKKMREVRAKQLAQQQAMQQQQANAEVFNKTKEAPEEGSPAQGLLQGSGLV